MSSSDESEYSDEETCDSESEAEQTITTLKKAGVLMKRLEWLLTKMRYLRTPHGRGCKLEGAEWVEQSLADPVRCRINFRLYPNEFILLHNILLNFGLRGTSRCSSMEALAMFLWTAAHQSSLTEGKDRLERSTGTLSTKVTEVLDCVYRWAETVVVPDDPYYQQVDGNLSKYSPLFDGCIGAIDGTFVKIRARKDWKGDCTNRKQYPSLNVCVIVDMSGKYVFVGSGMAGACHDQAVLEECRKEPNFPHPPAGRYYLADGGYMEKTGFMPPYRNTRYHRSDFQGVDSESLSLEERFNRAHSKLRNVIERRFGVMKGRWHILYGMPLYCRVKQAKMVAACCALENFVMWRKRTKKPPYELHEWVGETAGWDIPALREYIAVGLQLANK